MKTAAATVAVTVGLTLTACGGNEAPTTTADCSLQVRLEGIVYTSYGFTDHRATHYGQADVAECEDVGQDARGSVFPSSPRHVRTWTFAAYPPTKVVGTRSGKTDSFAVFVADSVSPAERDRIFEDLARESR
jgi:hypothetical protein